MPTGRGARRGGCVLVYSNGYLGLRAPRDKPTIYTYIDSRSYLQHYVHIVLVCGGQHAVTYYVVIGGNMPILPLLIPNYLLWAFLQPVYPLTVSGKRTHQVYLRDADNSSVN